MRGPHPSEVSPARPALLSRWLFVVALMVVVIVAVGGITRLTESGLSITRWELVGGILPPLSEAVWVREFARYQQTPQFRLESGPAGMDLAWFKFIYFWEWFHRVLGRVIGLAIALPLAWFWWRGAILEGYKGRLLAILGMISLQGVFGWFMVRSGLSGEMTAVSHFWLSLHLMTALLTLGVLIWTALDLKRMAAVGRAQPARWTWPATIAGAVLALQLLLGAWVAGLDAGHASDSWPLMQDRLVPEFDASRGLLYAATHDPFLLHFLHRWWAWAAVIALVWIAARVRPLERRASIAIHAAVGTQILLGIATVLSGVALWLAVAHQLMGALLVAAFAWGAHILGRVPRPVDA